MSKLLESVRSAPKTADSPRKSHDSPRKAPPSFAGPDSPAIAARHRALATACAHQPRPAYVPLSDLERAETRILAAWTPPAYDPEADFGWYDDAFAREMHGKGSSVPTTPSAPGKAESYSPAIGSGATGKPVASAPAPLILPCGRRYDEWFATAWGFLWGWAAAWVGVLAVAGALWIAPPQWTPTSAPALILDAVAPGFAPAPARPSPPIPSYSPSPPPMEPAPSDEDDGPCSCLWCRDVRLA